MEQSAVKQPEVIRCDGVRSSYNSLDTNQASSVSNHSFHVLDEDKEIDFDCDKASKSIYEDLSPENYNKWLLAQNNSNVQKFQDDTVEAFVDIVDSSEVEDMKNLEKWISEDKMVREMTESKDTRHKTEKAAALQGRIKKPNYEEFGMPEPLYSVGNIQLVCSTCEQILEKLYKKLLVKYLKEQDNPFKETFSYFTCRCQRWRISDKDIERWAEQARKDGRKFERIPLNRCRYI